MELEQVLFPISGLTALLGVTARFDDQRNVLYIDLVEGGSPPPSGVGFLLTDLEYGYSLSTNGAYTGQSASAHGRAVAGSTNLSASAQISRNPGGLNTFLNRASLRADFDRSHAAIFGDQSVYAGLDSMTNSMRGAGYEQKLGAYRINAYGGMAVSSSGSTFGASISRYDTALGGFSLLKSGVHGTVSAGASTFRNDNRRGTLFGAAFTRTTAMHQFSIQLNGGSFSGLSLQTVPVDRGANASDEIFTQTTEGASILPRYIKVQGPGYGVSVLEAFLPSSRVTFSGQIDYYSKNFLTAREDARFNGAVAETLAFGIRPVDFLQLSASASNRSFLLGDSQRSRSYSIGGNLSLPWNNLPQFGFMRILQFNESGMLPRFEMRQYSMILPRFGRYSGAVHYTQNSFGAARISSLNAMANAEFGRFGSVGLHYQSQNESLRRFGSDWNFQLGESGYFLRAGADVLQSRSRPSQLFPLVGLRVRLPGRQILELNYYRESGTQLLQLRIGGALVQPVDVQRDSRGQPMLSARTSISGRLYIDTDYDGRFSSGEKAVPATEVRLDNDRATVTDSQGFYRFDNVEPGSHRLHAELATVPAGYVFAESGAVLAAAVPGRQNRVDFRVIRTGQIEGRVTFLDYGSQEQAPVESPLPDARVIATGGQDTYTELNGDFLLGDLPPGVYELHLDPETVPPGLRSQPARLRVEVTPSSTIRGVKFRLEKPPRPVIEVQAPDQTIDLAYAEKKK